MEEYTDPGILATDYNTCTVYLGRYTIELTLQSSNTATTKPVLMLIAEAIAIKVLISSVYISLHPISC